MVAFFVCSKTVGSDVDNNKIVLGQSAALSGSAEALGTEFRKGALAYFAKINSSGGVNKRRIEILTLDDGYDGDRALLNTINLVKKHKVFGLFGYVGTPTIVKALPAIRKLHKDEKVFLFSNFTGANPQRNSPYLDYVFNVRASYQQETQGLVDQLYKLGYRKFGLFIQYDAYGRSGADGVRKALEKYDLEVIDETTYRRGVGYKTSMMKQAQRIQEREIEVVISVGAYQECAAFVRDLRAIGDRSIIANVSFVGSDQMVEILEKESLSTGIDYTFNLINSQVVPAWSDITNKIVDEYQKDLQVYGGNAQYNYISLEGYISAKSFVEYLKLTGEKVTRKKFVNVVKNTSPIQIGLKTPLGFKKGSNQATDQVYYTSFENYKPREIVDWRKFKK